MLLPSKSFLVALLAGAFLLRIAFLLLAGVNAPLTGDELAYQQIAENVTAGRGFFQTNNPFFPGQVLYAWQAPLYPLALGILYTLFGNHVLLAKLFGVLVSSATVYVVYDLTLRVARFSFLEKERAHRRVNRVALTAGFLIAIYPGLLTHAHLLLSETLYIFLLVLAFDLVARGLDTTSPRKWLWLGSAGVAWGLAILTRGLTLYFTPVLALWMVWVLWGARLSERTESLKRSPGGAVLGAVLFLGMTAVVIAPWTMRNYSQFGEFVLLETKGGVNLWLGNSPYTPDEFIRNVWKVGVREPMLNVLPQDEVLRDRTAYALALDYVRGQPLTFLARMPAKFADFWGFERNLVDVAGATTRGEGWNSLTKIGADLFGAVVYIMVMVCGVTGLILARNDAWKILFTLFILYFLGVHLVIFGDGRFHLPMIPFFAIYAGWLFVSFRQVEWTRSGLALAVVCVLLLLLVWVREAWVALGMFS